MVKTDIDNLLHCFLSMYRGDITLKRFTALIIHQEISLVQKGLFDRWKSFMETVEDQNLDYHFLLTMNVNIHTAAAQYLK